MWRADNSQVWGADGGWISVWAGGGGLIIVRCMLAEVITWCGGINVKETCSVLRAGAYSLGLEALGLHR